VLNVLLLGRVHPHPISGLLAPFLVLFIGVPYSQQNL
jgi:hypothetical protein